jgi:outer membrane lipoprotein carrier protein
VIDQRSTRLRGILLVVVLACVAPRVAGSDANEPAAQLAALLVPVQHLKAEFTQTVLGARRELLQSAEGYVRIARPQQFKWVLLAPYPQTIVTVGDRLYVYDPDLQQVQVKPLAQALTGTPALVLLGTAAEIAAQFEVTKDSVEGLEQFGLTPKDADAVYTEIRMTFSAKSLVRIEIVDSLGQLTDVNFHNLEINGPMSQDEFEFTVPPDADLIGDVAPKPA